MKEILSKIVSLLSLLVVFQVESCGQTNNGSKSEGFNQIPIQRVDYADSLFILCTMKGLSQLGWWPFEDYSKMYKIENSDVNYFIGRVFYDSKKLKMIVWYGEKTYNAPTINSYSDDPKKNRICPKGGDTVYMMDALIGYRDSTHQIWNLYPFNNQSAVCFSKKESAINVMEQYYFREMKNHEMGKIIQTGEKKGEYDFVAYGYNLQDEDFWNKCWLWEKDTVGSNGLYPFQIKEYIVPHGSRCDKCAKPFDVPKIDYPEEILKLYNK